MRWVRDFHPQADQNKLYRQALIITLVGNLFLAILKGIVAYISQSAAIFSDAANSISDVVYSLLMVLGLWVAMQPPDLSHPQGHSRFEPLVGMLVTLSMAFAGFTAANNSFQRYLEGGEIVKWGLPTIVLLTSAALKAGMFVSISRIARKLSSPTLRTTAKDNLSDVLTSICSIYRRPRIELYPSFGRPDCRFRCCFMDLSPGVSGRKRKPGLSHRQRCH